MNEVRRRVAQKREAGLYAIDNLASDRGRANEPFRADDLAEVCLLAAEHPGPLFDLVRGDAHRVLGDDVAARDAYASAREALPSAVDEPQPEVRPKRDHREKRSKRDKENS